MGYAEGKFISGVLLLISPAVFVLVKLAVVAYITLPFRYSPIHWIFTNEGKYSKHIGYTVLVLICLYLLKLSWGNLMIILG